MTAEEFKQETETLQPSLTLVAQRYLHNKEDAEDVVQDVLMKLWGMLVELHRPMAALARVLVRNFCIDHIRRHPNVQQLSSTSESQVLNMAENSLVASHPQQEMIDRMMRSMEYLPPKQQLILRLRHMDGMSTREIAQLTGHSEAAIRQTLCRARQEIRNIYLKNREK